MDSRTRLAVGGMATVAASVAVICTVALTNSVALAHSDGTPVRGAKVVVPASPHHAGTAGSAPMTTPAPAAEVVPAPPPVVMAPSTGGPSPSTPYTGSPAPGPTADSRGEAIAEARRSGSWDTVRKLAARWGWSDERIDAWIAGLDTARDARGDRSTWTGREKERPADAGANAGDGPLWSGHGARKDRSPVSPDLRDR